MDDKKNVFNIIYGDKTNTEEEPEHNYDISIVYIDGSTENFEAAFFGVSYDDSKFLLFATSEAEDGDLPPILIRIDQIRKIVSKRIK